MAVPSFYYECNTRDANNMSLIMVSNNTNSANEWTAKKKSEKERTKESKTAKERRSKWKLQKMCNRKRWRAKELNRPKEIKKKRK